MRYLVLSLFALGLSFSSVDSASASPRWHRHKPKPPKVKEVPELDGNALPAALTLLAGATIVVMSRRRESPKALP